MKRFGLLFATCMTPFALQPALAQTNPTTGSTTAPAVETVAPAPAPAAADAAPADGQLGDIVVTAQRRKERLQSIPIVVTAFSEQAIAQLHISDALMTSKFVPGMVSQHNAGL